MADGSGLFLHEPVRAGYRHVGVISNPTSFSRGLDPRDFSLFAFGGGGVYRPGS